MVGFRIFDVGLLVLWLVWFFRLRDDDADANDDGGDSGGGGPPPLSSPPSSPASVSSSRRRKNQTSQSTSRPTSKIRNPTTKIQPSALTCGSYRD